MMKRDELANPQSCLNRAHDDEMLFVLLARDVAAPLAIVTWVAERLRRGKNTKHDRQIQEALACARYMEIEQGVGRVPPPLKRSVPYGLIFLPMLIVMMVCFTSYQSGKAYQSQQDAVTLNKATANFKADMAALETRTALRVQLANDRDRESLKLAGTAMDALDELRRLRHERALLEPFIKSGNLVVIGSQH